MTEHFTMSDMLYSGTAVQRKIWNGAGHDEERNLQALMSVILEPLRQAYGKPVHISSGYRCPALNRLVGGTATSQHMAGEAADIDAGTRAENRRLARLIADMGLPFDQLIDEHDYAWVHVSYRLAGHNRRQILRLRGGRYYVTDAGDL